MGDAIPALTFGSRGGLILRAGVAHDPLRVLSRSPLEVQSKGLDRVNWLDGLRQRLGEAS